MSTPLAEAKPEHSGKFYTLFVDGTEYSISTSKITGAQVMALAGIPMDAGLLLIEGDGTQRTVLPEEVIELGPGRRFGKAPRYKRGAR